MEKAKPKSTVSNIFKAESYLNSGCHIINGAIAVYVTFVCNSMGWSREITWHVWLCTLGYQLLMAEAIMVYYGPNTWSIHHTKNTKNYLHLVLQVLAFGFICAGNTIYYMFREKRGARHFDNKHAELGLVSWIMLIISVLQGGIAFFATSFSKLVKPVHTKLFHNVTSIVCFTVGFSSLCYGYKLRTFRTMSTDTIIRTLIWAGIVSTVLASIGALKSMYYAFRSTFNL